MIRPNYYFACLLIVPTPNQQKEIIVGISRLTDQNLAKT